MKKTLMKIGSVLIITALMAAVTVAAEKTAAADDSGAKIKKLEALGAVRARLGEARSAVANMADNNLSGWTAKGNEISSNYTRLCQLLDKVTEQEKAKPAAEQKAELLQAIQNERENVQQLWTKYSKMECHTKMSLAYTRVTYGFIPACDTLSTIDSYWTKLNLLINSLNVTAGWTKLTPDILDTDLLKAMSELENCALEIKSQQQAAMAELDNQVKFWQDTLTNATSRYNALIGASGK